MTDICIFPQATGGSGGDPQNNAQDKTNNLLGKMLRIDPLGNNSSNGQYGNPPGNPFVGVTGDDEIWAYGLRNPWRCCFDSLTGDLYIADVGQGSLEEIDVQPAADPGGTNYGWRVREGTSGGALSGAIDPIYDYQHGSGANEGFSVTGGCVYRGPINVLQGHYFFADYVTDRVWSLKWNGSAPSTHNGTNYTEYRDWTDLITTSSGSIANISSFGEDDDGNLYIVELAGEVLSYQLGRNSHVGNWSKTARLHAHRAVVLTGFVRERRRVCLLRARTLAQPGQATGGIVYVGRSQDTDSGRTDHFVWKPRWSAVRRVTLFRKSA